MGRRSRWRSSRRSSRSTATRPRGGLIPVQPRDTVRVGPWSIEFLRVTHSIPDAIALAIQSPVGTIIHTGDFKVDQTPLDGQHFDLHRFAELGGQGVLACSETARTSNGRDTRGPSSTFIEAFEELFASTRGKLVVTAFATSIYRMQILANLAQEFGRKLAFAAAA